MVDIMMNWVNFFVQYNIWQAYSTKECEMRAVAATLDRPIQCLWQWNRGHRRCGSIYSTARNFPWYFLIWQYCCTTKYENNTHTNSNSALTSSMTIWRGKHPFRINIHWMNMIIPHSSCRTARKEPTIKFHSLNFAAEAWYDYVLYSSFHQSCWGIRQKK